MARVAAVQGGIGVDIRRQRLLLFGNNEIHVEGKSTLSLLIDEVCFILLCYH
jgi:cation-transporting ATPase 13A2